MSRRSQPGVPLSSPPDAAPAPPQVPPRRFVSERHGVAAKMIATVEDLETLAANPRAKIPMLSGWRHEIFGEKALELIDGRLALTLEKGKVVTLEWQDAPETGAPKAAASAN